MKKIILISLYLGILSPHVGFAQDLSTYESRKQWLLDEIKDVELIESGKHGMPKAIVRLHHNPHDQAALTYITSVLDNRFQNMFDFPGVALALCRYWDSFSPAQREKLQHDLERLAKPEKGKGEDFMGHGTENHATVMWAGAYLFGQLFPDAQWANGMTSKELMAEMKERMRKAFKNYYKNSQTEYLSTTYEVTMNHPIEILREYAKEPEMKEIADAFLLFKWSLNSLNTFEGTTIAPHGRMNTQQDHQPVGKYVAGATYVNWLFWGWGPATGNVTTDYKNRMTDYTAASDITFALYPALSNTVPDEVFFKLGNLKEPYMLKSSASTFGAFGGGAPHMMMRKVYRSKSYAIGSGNFRWVPGGDYADHDTNGFNIIWSTSDRFNYIDCYAPFWYSDGDLPERTPDTWYKGSISPFQQTAHHKNAAIILFNIPDKDPWPGKPHGKWEWRDGHADNLIKRGMLRFPKSIDEQIEENGWIFLREGKTYIGIKPLKEYYIQNNLIGKAMVDDLSGFNIVKSDYAQTGFIFELGSEEESGNFEKFRNKLKQNKIAIDWNKMTVSYTSSQKDKIQIRYIPGLSIADVRVEARPDYWERMGVTGLAESVPEVIINGKKEIPYQQWPMIESPYINMNNSILKIDDGQTKIIVDWTGRNPIIQRDK
jgi:hypothetical protein